MLTTLRKAEYAELMILFFIQAAAMGIWFVPLGTIIDAHGLQSIKPFAFAASAPASSSSSSGSSHGTTIGFAAIAAPSGAAPVGHCSAPRCRHRAGLALLPLLIAQPPPPLT